MAKITELQDSLRKLAGELETAQRKMNEGGLNEAEGKDFTAKAQEALEIQKQIDTYNLASGVVAKSRESGAPVMPASKREQAEENGHETVGYVTPGEAFVRSDAYRKFIEAGMPEQNIRIAGSRDMVKGYMPVTREEKAAWDAMDRKTVPTFAAGVIEPTRLAGINLSVQDDELNLLSVITQGSTGSNAVEYLRLAYTRAADAVAAGDEKPEAAAAYTLETATVRTHAVTIPVTEQMLADAPSLITAVNGRLMYDLNKLLEEQILYGAGSGQDFAGILNDSDVEAAPAGDTVIDQIRRAMAQIRKSGFRPNAVVMDPVDAAELVLTKGTDDHYLYQVFPTQDGGTMVWGIRIVESASMEETALASFPERNILIGDFARGATLWNRSAISLAVGYVDDDFRRNKRTIRAERRAAFAVTEPLAFRKIVTHVASGAS
jgi:HK97 family phage major capsid protein